MLTLRKTLEPTETGSAPLGGEATPSAVQTQRGTFATKALWPSKEMAGNLRAPGPKGAAEVTAAHAVVSPGSA